MASGATGGEFGSDDNPVAYSLAYLTLARLREFAEKS